MLLEEVRFIVQMGPSPATLTQDDSLFRFGETSCQIFNEANLCSAKIRSVTKPPASPIRIRDAARQELVSI
jgi:hypothetical protein